MERTERVEGKKRGRKPYPEGYPKSPNTAIIAAASAVNERKQCVHPGCYQSRLRISKYCKVHWYQVANYGGVGGVPIHPSKYQLETELVERFLHRHKDHPAIIAATRFFDRWLKDASMGDEVAGKKELAHMADEGITGAECLPAVLSLYLYSKWHRESLPGGPLLVFALALALLRCAGRKKTGVTWGVGSGKLWKDGRRQFLYRSIPTRPRRAIGEQILSALGTFLANAAAGIEADEAAANQSKLDLLKRFEPSQGYIPPSRRVTPPAQPKEET